jgi:hypothetical protein
VTVDCPGFKELERMPGSCLRCGRVEIAHAEAAEPVHNLRDPLFEDQALRMIAGRSANPQIQRLVSERLDWGDREYAGLFNRRGDDGLKEAADEAIDGIAWLFLQLQNRELDGDAREYVMRACTAFAEAHRELAAARACSSGY